MASSYLYVTYYTPEDGDEGLKISNTDLYMTLVSLFSIWLLSAIIFVTSIKKEYLHTFYSTQISKEYHEKFFSSLGETQDSEKSAILLTHPSIYSPFSDKIKVWTHDNWKQWETLKPDWFTVTWIKSIEREFIPYEYRVKYGQTGLKRDGSMGRCTFGGIREKSRIRNWGGGSKVHLKS